VKAHLVSPSGPASVYRVFYRATKLTNGNVVVIVDGNEVSELQVASHRSSLAGNTLHSAAIAKEHECVVVDQVEAGLVEDSGSVCLGHGKTNGIGETLAKRAGGDLDTGSVVGLRVTRGDRVDLLDTCSVTAPMRFRARVLEHLHGSSSSHRW
jgi:hypothetical protein